MSKKTGLRSLLGTGSDVRDRYRLLETVQSSFKVSWQIVKRPQDLGNPPLKAEITESGKLQFYIPGTLEYKLNNLQNQTEIAIIGGIHLKRLGRFKFKGFDRFPNPRNFTLLDEGKLLGELKTVKLTIILSQNNSKVSEMSYPLVPHRPYPHWADAYQINLGDRFDSWLFSETYQEAYCLDAVLKAEGKRKILIGAFFGLTPRSATLDRVQDKWEAESGGLSLLAVSQMQGCTILAAG